MLLLLSSVQVVCCCCCCCFNWMGLARVGVRGTIATARAWLQQNKRCNDARHNITSISIPTWASHHTSWCAASKRGKSKRLSFFFLLSLFFFFFYRSFLGRRVSSCVVVVKEEEKKKKEKSFFFITSRRDLTRDSINTCAQRNNQQQFPSLPLPQLTVYNNNNNATDCY